MDSTGFCGYTNKPIAQLWKHSGGYLIEICAGGSGARVTESATFKSKVDAKQYAKSKGATPWNYR